MLCDGCLDAGWARDPRPVRQMKEIMKHELTTRTELRQLCKPDVLSSAATLDELYLKHYTKAGGRKLTL